MTATAGPAAALRGYPGAVIRLDDQGVVVDSNGRLEAELGRELVGRPLAEAVDAASSGEKWLALLGAAAESPRVAELVLCRDGGPLEPRPFAVFRADDAPWTWVFELRQDPRLEVMTREVTAVNSELSTMQRVLVKEQRRLAAALESEQRLRAVVEAQRAELTRSNAALDEFAHVVSHDLKAPLRALTAFAGWIQEDPAAGALGERARSGLARLQDRVERLRQMIDGALAYAQAARADARPERLDLRHLVTEVAELVDSAGVVRVDIPEPMGELVAARDPLRQVLLNLLANAVRFSAAAAAPQVVVTVAERAGRMLVSVHDNGAGIPPERLPGIWGLFRTGGAPESGSGIGLAVVRKLVEARGGEVTATSAPGQGATFSFTWPMNETSGPGVDE